MNQRKKHLNGERNNNLRKQKAVTKKPDRMNLILLPFLCSDVIECQIFRSKKTKDNTQYEKGRIQKKVPNQKKDKLTK